MKKYIYLILFLTQLIIAQNSNNITQDYRITYEKADFNRNILGGGNKGKVKFDNIKETVYWLTVDVKIENLKNETTFEFDCNNLSLVDSINLSRHKPMLITAENITSPLLVITHDFTNIGQVKLEDCIFEDTFLKHSQKGLRNYDHGWHVHKGKHRFYPTTFKKHKNRDIKLHMVFLTKSQKQGKFSLYYKNRLIENFIIEN